VPGSSNVSWTCNITLNVMGTTAGVKNNATSNVTSVDTIGNAASASLTVTSPGVVLAPSIAKAFGVSSVALNGTTSLTFTLANPNATALTGVAFTDALPPGLVVNTPNGLAGSCGGGTITAVAGSSSISLVGATLAGNGNCAFSVNVLGTTSGLKLNTTSAISSNEGGSGNQASAQLAVAAGAVAPPTFSKSFSGTATVGVPFNLTLNIGNPNGTAVTGIGFIDNLPPGLLVATPNGLTNTCGGTVSAVAGSAAISLSNVTLAGGASCTLTVAVVASTSGLITNVTTAIVSNEGGGGVAAVSSVTVNAAPVQPPTGQTPTTGTTPQVQATPIPNATSTPNVLVSVPPPIIPQVFQNPGAIGAIMNGPRNPPVPGAGAPRPAGVVLSASDPSVALRPPNTGNAGLAPRRAVGRAWRLLNTYELKAASSNSLRRLKPDASTNSREQQ
jgi:hypothetical protein